MDTDGADGDVDDDFNEPDIDLDIPERAELARLVCKQPEDLSDDELLERRIQFGECIVALISKRETVRRDIIAQRRGGGFLLSRRRRRILQRRAGPPASTTWTPPSPPPSLQRR